ncbi:MAG: hypothetical protein SOY92_02390 [Prevotella sp.]|nr:hypothetical protein [Prevotella sp.]
MAGRYVCNLPAIAFICQAERGICQARDVKIILLSGKTNNVVKDGLRSALPLARARKPNNNIFSFT